MPGTKRRKSSHPKRIIKKPNVLPPNEFESTDLDVENAETDTPLANTTKFSICHKLRTQRSINADRKIDIEEENSKKEPEADVFPPNFSLDAGLWFPQLSVEPTRRGRTPAKPADPTKVRQCPICFRTLYDKSTLNRHMLVHRGIKPYICSVCYASFRQKIQLRKHALQHHEKHVFQSAVE